MPKETGTWTQDGFGERVQARPDHAGPEGPRAKDLINNQASKIPENGHWIDLGKGSSGGESTRTPKAQGPNACM